MEDEVRWAEKYRPRAFEDVVGQETAVASLKGLIKEGIRHNVILTGPTGVGKTTLARIYSQAALCNSPLSSGSPCNSCHACRDHNARRLMDFTKQDCSLHSGKPYMIELLDNMNARPMTARFRVAFLDEAHRLSPAAQDLLLKPMEDWPHAVFVLALIDRQMLPRQLVDRGRLLRLEPPNSDEYLIYLRRICHHEAVEYEEEALELIAMLSSGFRNAAENLETVANAHGNRKVSVTGVSRRLSHNVAGRPFAFLRAACNGDWQQTAAALAQIELPSGDKARVILSLLLFVKEMNCASARTSASRAHLAKLLSEAELDQLSDMFAQRAAAHGVSFPIFFDEILEFWSYLPLHLTDEVLEIHSVRFHDLMHLERTGVAPSPPHLHKLPSADEEYRSNRALRSRGIRKFSAGGRETNRAYLNARQVRSIYEAATFLPQRYGVTFNSRIELSFAKLRISDEAGASDFMTDLLRQLSTRYATWASKLPDLPTGDLHRIASLERPSEECLIGNIVFHAAGELHARILRWVTESFLSGGDNGQAGYIFDFRAPSPSKRLALSARHWELVRTLWRGTDPDLVVGSTRLIDLLRVPEKDRRPAGLIKGHRYSMSETINKTARRQAREEGLGHLSPWEDGAWVRLFDHWELKEFVDRERERSEYAREVLGLEEDLQRIGDPATRRMLEERLRDRRASWHIDPKQHRRGWQGWWETGGRAHL